MELLMYRFFWLVLTAIVLFPASGLAQAQQKTQWKPAPDKNLIDFIEEGYELKSIIANHALVVMSPRFLAVTYYLQKGKQLALCTELSKAGQNLPDLPNPFSCFVLVKP